MRIVLTLIAVAQLATHTVAANVSTPKSTGTESLGGQLLRDLPGTIPQSTTTSPGAARDESQKAAQDRTATPVASPRFDDLGEGIGNVNGPITLVRAQQGMVRAGALLGDQASDSRPAAVQQAGEVQQQVIAQLDQLIAELSKQCQGGQCQPSDQPPEPSERSQTKPGKSGIAAVRGSAPARDSRTRLDRATAQPVDKGDVEELVKALWGHLPARQRDEMLQSFSGEFLPEYELEIEEYYRRLSDEQVEN